MQQYDGAVRVEITGDSSKIKKELKETEAAIKSTTESAAEMTNALENTSKIGNNFENITENADSAAKSISKAANETDSLGDSIKDEAKAAEQAGKRGTQLLRTPRRLQARLPIPLPLLTAKEKATLRLSSKSLTSLSRWCLTER